MSRPITVNYDLATGETTEREMNDTEYKDYLDQCAKYDKAKAEAETKATQRQAILDRLGLTEDEARLLLG
jgi:uncharacterized protein YdaT